MRGRLCSICNRPVWDGGSTITDTTCAKPNELLCLALEALRMSYKYSLAHAVLSRAGLE